MQMLHASHDGALTTLIKHRDLNPRLLSKKDCTRLWLQRGACVPSDTVLT